MNLTTLLWNEASITFAIDQFVKQVCFYPISDREILEGITYFYSIFKPFYRVQLSYVKSIECFIECTYWLEQFIDTTQPFSLQDLNTQQIDTLKMALRQYEQYYFYEQQYQHNLEISNRESLAHYMKQLLHHYSRLLVVRVDLSYAADQRHFIGIERAKSDLGILLNKISNKDTCFFGLQGYAWALEQGADKGYHCHLLLIYDPSKRKNDWYLANEVGSLWKDITQQQGIFYSCNTSEVKAEYARLGRLGVGPIHCDCVSATQNTFNAAMYLANPEKLDQGLLARMPRMRTFGTGQFDVSWRRGISETMQNYMK